jgi:hypothetical protein
LEAIIAMSIQPFVCIGAETIDDEALCSVSWMSRVLWTVLYQSVDSHWRFSADPRVIRGKCLAMYPDVRPADVTRCLDELLAAGLVVRRASEHTKAWVEIADRLRHRRRTFRDPRWGAAETPAEQRELPLGPVALSPPKRARLEAAPRLEQDKKAINRLEEKRTINRAVVGEEELIASLGEILPPSEMLKNGGGWRSWIRECKRAVQHAIEDWKVRTPEQRGAVKNRAAWLSDRYQRARAEIEQAKEARG